MIYCVYICGIVFGYFPDIPPHMQPQLNLPPCQLRLRQNAQTGYEEVWCAQRRKWVKLTPEEWVRQNFVQFLINNRQWPAGRIGNEVAIHVGKLERRCDTVVFDREGHPAVIVEYKATSVALTQKVFDQIARYNLELQVDWLLVSNGLQHYCCRLNRELRRFEFLREIPLWEQMGL